MKENVVAAGAGISVPARTGSEERPVLHPRKTSRESRDPVVIAHSFFWSLPRFRIADDQHSSEMNGSYVINYICGEDTSLINDITVVV
jgi:hypothetical protein